jgi:hypothetical protein
MLNARAPVSSPAAMAVGRVALLGDAAHPMLPYLAQGAGMAIEDAAELGSLLAMASAAALDVPLALSRYALNRWQRVARVQARALRNGRIFHATGVVQAGRDGSRCGCWGRASWMCPGCMAAEGHLSQRAVRSFQISGNSTTSSILRR